MPTLILILGKYGSGKSVSAATISYLGKTKYFALDENIGSIDTTTGEDGKKVIDEKARKNLDIISLSHITPEEAQTTPLIRYPVYESVSKGDAAPSAPFYSRYYHDVSMAFFDKLGEIFRDKVDAVVIDSFSSYMEMHVNACMTTNNVGSLRIQDYGTINRGVTSAFLGNLKLLPCKWVILVGHIKFIEDPKTGVTYTVPVASSETLSGLVPSNFSEVYVQLRDTVTPYWITGPYGIYTGSTKLNVPDIVRPADFRSLKEYLK